MAFDHFSFAVNGLQPGCNTYSIAAFGQYTIQIVVTPVQNYGGGGSIPVPDDREYYITVIIMHNGKVWSQKRLIGVYGIKTLETVKVMFSKVTNIREAISIQTSYIGNVILENIGIVSDFVGKKINNILVNIKNKQE